MAPHCCSCKLNTITALPKIFFPSSTFEIDRRFSLQHIYDVIMCKMASLNIIETSTTTNNLAHSQSKARKGKKIVVVQEQQLCCSFVQQQLFTFSNPQGEQFSTPKLQCTSMHLKSLRNFQYSLQLKSCIPQILKKALKPKSTSHLRISNCQENFSTQNQCSADLDCKPAHLKFSRKFLNPKLFVQMIYGTEILEKFLVLKISSAEDLCT